MEPAIAVICEEWIDDTKCFNNDGDVEPRLLLLVWKLVSNRQTHIGQTTNYQSWIMIHHSKETQLDAETELGRLSLTELRKIFLETSKLILFLLIMWGVGTAPIPSPVFHPIMPISALNSHAGGTAIAQLNLSRRVFENTFSMGTSFRLHQATEIRGSM